MGTKTKLAPTQENEYASKSITRAQQVKYLPWEPFQVEHKRVANILHRLKLLLLPPRRSNSSLRIRVGKGCKEEIDTKSVWGVEEGCFGQ